VGDGELSMGMSGDLELAIAEGATCVRAGRDFRSCADLLRGLRRCRHRVFAGGQQYPAASAPLNLFGARNVLSLLALLGLCMAITSLAAGGAPGAWTPWRSEADEQDARDRDQGDDVRADASRQDPGPDARRLAEDGMGSEADERSYLFATICLQAAMTISGMLVAHTVLSQPDRPRSWPREAGAPAGGRR
jgi:hypothetical protein